MTPFTIHSGVVAALPRVNVDTDQIIPKQFLKRVEPHRVWHCAVLRLAFPG